LPGVRQWADNIVKVSQSQKTWVPGRRTPTGRWVGPAGVTAVVRMANISDFIESYLRNLLAESETGVIEIGRNELALKFQCVPSQINYVLTTRFTLGRGFCVESKKGGGGYIRIIRLVAGGPRELLDTVCKEIGQELSEQGAAGVLARLTEAGVLQAREARLMKSVLAAGTPHLAPEDRGRFRADLMRAMLGTVLRKGGR